MSDPTASDMARALERAENLRRDLAAVLEAHHASLTEAFTAMLPLLGDGLVRGHRPLFELVVQAQQYVNSALPSAQRKRDAWITGRLQAHRQAARRRKRLCYAPNCDGEAVWSHLLQKNGVLDQIAVDGRIVELREDDLFRRNSERRWYFSRPLHINDAFTFLGFCARHDNDLFADIENRSPDLTTASAAHRLSYRALLNELQKIENNIDWYQRLFRDEELLREMPLPLFRNYEALLQRMEMGAVFARENKRAFERELGLITDDTKFDFTFETRSIEKLDICTSATFGFTTAEVSATEGSNVEFDNVTYFIHVLPGHDSTTLILGGDRRDPLQLLGRCDAAAVVSEILLKWTETWACSPRWYEATVRPREADILAEKTRLLGPERKRDAPRVHLFDAA